MLVVLPTGYGKSVICTGLLLVFDKLRGKTAKNGLVVVYY